MQQFLDGAYDLLMGQVGACLCSAVVLPLRRRALLLCLYRCVKLPCTDDLLMGQVGGRLPLLQYLGHTKADRVGEQFSPTLCALVNFYPLCVP